MQFVFQMKKLIYVYCLFSSLQLYTVDSTISLSVLLSVQHIHSGTTQQGTIKTELKERVWDSGFFQNAYHKYNSMKMKHEWKAQILHFIQVIGQNEEREGSATYTQYTKENDKNSRSHVWTHITEQSLSMLCFEILSLMK